MTSSRPYLIRALYEWIIDNDMTPHMLVNAQIEGVEVPSEHVHEGRIVLNTNPSAVQDMQIGNGVVEFSARFGGIARLVRVPTGAIMAIYAKENGKGMAFGDDQDGDEPPPDPQKRPTLKIVK